MGMERDVNGERERENVSMAAESGGGVFSSSKLELHNKGGLLVNAVCHDSRKKENPNA